MKKNLTIILFLLLFLISLWGIKNLFGGTFYTNHDGYTHTARIAQYFIAFSDGQFPPRWAGTLNSGFGSPIFVYSYPLPYIFGALLHGFGISFTSAFKIIIAVSFIISSFFMFLFLREIFSKISAFVGSVFFILAPYRFLNIYVRGSLSESLAYMVVPLVFFALTKLWKKKSNFWIAFTAFSFSFLMLSQYLVAAIFLPVYIMLAFIFFIQDRNVAFLFKVGLAIILSFGLSAVSFAPVFFERNFIKFSESIAYYASHFVEPFQLIRSPWGYGFSLPGLNDSMSFQIGLIHLLVTATSFVFLFIFFIRKARKKKENSLQWSLLFLSYVLFVITVVLMIEWPVAKFLWQNIPFLTTIDLPWRFLGLTVFTSSIIASYLVEKMNPKFLVVPLIILLMYANRNHIRVNQYIDYPDEEFLFYRGTATWVNEYTPIWRSSVKFHEPKERYYVKSENEIDINVIESKSNKLMLETNSKKNSVIRLNIFYFPGWTIYLDDRKLDEHYGFSITTIDDGIKDGPDESGLIDVVVPEGKHTILVEFKETPIRKAGNIVSFVSLISLPVISYIIPSKKKRLKK